MNLLVSSAHPSAAGLMAPLVEVLLHFLDGQGGHGQPAATNAEVLEHLKQNTLGASKRPQLVVFFTNGSFDGIIGRYVSAVRAAGS